MVEFVLVAPLVILLGVAVIQLALLMQVRATLTRAAGEGARAGALAGADTLAAAARARAIAAQTLGGVDLTDVRAEAEFIDGLPVMTLEIDATVPLIGPFGTTAIEVVGHALLEAPG
ncbi:MAG: TadE/TadG family type IV pilus assembly protein [Candidatus Nanopelagicales bacterium]